jgi:hypothetical protein
VSSRTARATQRNPVLKEKQTNKQKRKYGATPVDCRRSYREIQKNTNWGIKVAGIWVCSVTLDQLLCLLKLFFFLIFGAEGIRDQI